MVGTREADDEAQRPERPQSHYLEIGQFLQSEPAGRPARRESPSSLFVDSLINRLADDFLVNGVLPQPETLPQSIIDALERYFLSHPTCLRRDSPPKRTSQPVANLVFLYNTAARGGRRDVLLEAYHQSISLSAHYLDLFTVFASYRAISREIVDFVSHPRTVREGVGAERGINLVPIQHRERLTRCVDTYRDLDSDYYFGYRRPWRKALTDLVKEVKGRVTRYEGS